MSVTLDVSLREFAPVARSERIATLDVLRGFGLFGVLWANLNADFGAPDWYDTLYGTLSPAAFRTWLWPVSGHLTTVDGALAWTQAWVINGRFYTLLGFLFGIGFAIQLSRAERRGEDVRKMFYRRVLVLFVFGLVNGALIFNGDVLTAYALAALFLPFYARLHGRGLLAAAAATYLILPYVLQKSLDLMQVRLLDPASGLNTVPVYEHGTFAQITAVRVHEFFLHQVAYIELGCVFNFLTLFVLGMWVERTGIISKLSKNIHLVRRTFWIGLLCAAAGFVCDHYFALWWPQPIGAGVDFWSPRFLVRRVLNFGSNYSLIVWGTSAAYAAALTLLAQRPGWARRLEPLAALGRMPLTTYLMQCVIITILFYGYGLAWYGQVGLGGMLAITFVLFPLQMAFSVYWLGRFRFGPAEWVWRSLSYGSAQPMKVGAQAHAAGSGAA